MIKKILFLFFVVFAATAYSQDVTITGTVTDANSEPLVGVNVLVKGTTTGAITDIDGNFSVSGKKGSTLVFSYIGMLTQEVVYKGTALRVVMKDDSKALEEVVVIGYQTVKKSDLTGAVAVVDTKEMKALQEHWSARCRVWQPVLTYAVAVGRAKMPLLKFAVSVL